MRVRETWTRTWCICTASICVLSNQLQMILRQIAWECCELKVCGCNVRNWYEGIIKVGMSGYENTKGPTSCPSQAKKMRPLTHRCSKPNFRARHVWHVYIYWIYPPVKVTRQWKITISNRKYIFKGPMFHCYVCWPECIPCLFAPPVKKNLENHEADGVEVRHQTVCQRYCH